MRFSSISPAGTCASKGMKPAIFSTLFWKDLLRVRRKPVAYMVNILIPLLMTGMIGFVFQPGGDGGNALGVMKLAIVDEDQSVVGEFLAGAVNNEEFREYMDLRFLEEEAAMASLLDNEISGILILPDGFSEAYLLGEDVPPLRLIKNPAHQFHPAVLEEMMGVVVEGLSAVYRIAGEDLLDWKDVLEEEGVPDMTRIAGLILRLGDRFEAAGELLFPPLIQYGTDEPEAGAEDDDGPEFNLFAFILPGFVGLFMFFLADNVVRDIYREELARTLERYRYFQGSLVPFMASKGLVSMLVVMLSMYVTIGFGVVIFGIHLNNVVSVLLYVGVYSFFVTGFILFLNAMSGTERRADTLNPIIVFTLAFLGGNMVPAQNLPGAITENISYLLPNFWFIRGMQHLQFGWYDVTIMGYSLLMIALGLFFLYLGARILHGKLEGRRL